MKKYQGPMFVMWCALVCAVGLASPPIAAAADADRDDAPWLGVYTQRLTESLRAGIDYRGEGVLVNRVVEDSPADRAGIEKGDVIVSVNSRTAQTPQELSTIVRGARAGQNVRVIVVRDGTRKSLDVRLGSRSVTETEDEMNDNDSPDKDDDGDRDSDTWDTPVPPVPPVPGEAPEPPSGIRSHGYTNDVPEGNVFLRGMGRGRLGVRIEDLNADLGDYFGVPDGKGALIVEVLKDTPAERAGLKAGDVITSVDGHAVSDASELMDAIGDADGKVALKVVRKGNSRTIETELEKGARTFRYRTGPLGMREQPDRRIRVITPDRDDSKELREQVRELREELRTLRERLDHMNHD